MAKKQKKVVTFKSAKEKAAWELFMNQHLNNILQCADLSHFMVSGRELRMSQSDRDGGMSVEIDYKYLDFELNCYSAFVVGEWEEKDYNTLIRYLCHEVTHLVTEEIPHRLDFDKKQYKSSGDIRLYMERVTEHTSRWLYQLYQFWMIDMAVDIKTGQSKSFDKLVKDNRKQYFK